MADSLEGIIYGRMLPPVRIFMTEVYFPHEISIKFKVYSLFNMELLEVALCI